MNISIEQNISIFYMLKCIIVIGDVGRDSHTRGLWVINLITCYSMICNYYY